VTEFYNGTSAKDYILLSSQGAYQGCTQDTGCVFGFNVTTGVVPTAPTAGTAEAGGTSGIIIDNESSLSGALFTSEPIAHEPVGVKYGDCKLDCGIRRIGRARPDQRTSG
jgi:hypothetical protein